MEKLMELKAFFDTKKEFYGKAKTLDSETSLILISYEKDILKLDKESGDCEFLTRNENDLTMTTNRHINEFLKQYSSLGYKSLTKKQILSLFRQVKFNLKENEKYGI